MTQRGSSIFRCVGKYICEICKKLPKNKLDQLTYYNDKGVENDKILETLWLLVGYQFCITCNNLTLHPTRGRGNREIPTPITSSPPVIIRLLTTSGFKFGRFWANIAYFRPAWWGLYHITSKFSQLGKEIPESSDYS